MFSRSVSTALVATATAVALTAQTAPPALADPPAASAASPASAASAASAAAAASGPGERPVSELLRDLRQLYRKTEAATRKYERTDRKLDAQRVKVEKLEKRLKNVRTAVDDGRAVAGRLARRQYQGEVPGFPPLLRLLLADDPRRALDQGHALRRAVGAQTADVKRLTSGERRQSALVVEVREAFDRRRKLAERHRGQRNEVRDRLREVEELLASLSDDELAVLERMEELKQPERAGAAGAAGPEPGQPAVTSAR